MSRDARTDPIGNYRGRTLTVRGLFHQGDAYADTVVGRDLASMRPEGQKGVWGGSAQGLSDVAMGHAG